MLDIRDGYGHDGLLDTAMMSSMKLGLEVFLESSSLQKQLAGKRVALLGHPASVDQNLRHALDLIAERTDLNLTCAFGPQHGMRGDKQDNMIETADYDDPLLGIPVFSLYGEVRRPTEKMMDSFDVLLVDLQDIGTRIYTYVTTLRYMLEACSQKNKSLWVLDRPNPVGRPVEGSLLRPGWESFVGAGPLTMRHGLTLGELALWFKKNLKLEIDLKVIPMESYNPDQPDGYGWPNQNLVWVNPSPNAATLNMARCFPGTVLLEGTTLSEGRGTTHPLELMGAPGLDHTSIAKEMLRLKPEWMEGCRIRPCYFQPTFHKHQNQLCAGFQIHAEGPLYKHNKFKPYRMVALYFKAIRRLHPSYELWRKFHYEYETDRLAIDLLSGGTFLREWVDNPSSTPQDFDTYLTPDETQWTRERQSSLLYVEKR